MISFTEIHSVTHRFVDGIVEILVPFTGNILSIQCGVKAEYQVTKQVIGYLYQHSGIATKGYAIYGENTYLELGLPETDKLIFVPTSYLNDSYSLIINYALVGSVINGENTTPLPELITGLPTRVSALEAFKASANTELENLSNSQNDAINSLTAIDDSIASLTGDITSHHSRLETLESEVSANSIHLAEIDGTLTSNGTAIAALGNRITDIEASGFASIEYTEISVNSTLESNQKYFAAITGLICVLPANPSIGDTIDLSTGNYSFRVNHGNANQAVLNLSTQTNVGINNGIILKPYSSIQLIYQGSNLWVSACRARVINNYVVPAIESTSSIKAYIASSLEPYAYEASNFYTPELINDGNKTALGVMKTGGGTANELHILATFPTSTILTALNYWLGQYNGNYNKPTSLDVYIGSGKTPENLITTHNFTSADSGSISIANADSSLTFVFVFRSNTNKISVLEIEAIGKQILGGETIVV